MLEHILFFCVLTILVGLYLWIKALRKCFEKQEKENKEEKKEKESLPGNQAAARASPFPRLGPAHGPGAGPTAR